MNSPLGKNKQRCRTQVASCQRNLKIEQLERRELLSLTHLYTFNDGTARDWVGDAHGTLHNGASVVDGQLTLQNVGVTSGQGGLVQHAQLPGGVLSSGSATVEVWFTAQNLPNWTRVFDIGDYSGDAVDSYLFFTAQSGSNDSRTALKPSGLTERVATTSTTDDGVEHVAAVVVDSSTGFLRLYLDGSLVGSGALSGAHVGSVDDALVYVGRSLFGSDPGLTGSINELRIYDAAVSATELAENAATGPLDAFKAGDYDASDRVNGADFLAWQRGDNSNMGLGFWQANYGADYGVTETLDLDNESATYNTLLATTATLTGRSELHLTGDGNSLLDSVVHLDSEDAWLFFDNLKPEFVDTGLMGQVRVNGAVAERDVNVRVVQYELGTVVIPHAPDFEPLEAFTGVHFTGASQTFGLYTYYDDAAALGEMQGTISSLKLKHGYMATIATNPDGTGSSKVYIAQDDDVEIPILPGEYDNAVQFIRVFPWRWVAKKGASDISPFALDAAWHYNWNNSLNSPLDWEYVPIKQQVFWPGDPTNKPDSTHWLGFNEPNNPVEDAWESLGEGSVDAAIDFWPNMLRTGLRVGAPAVTDGGKGWLYEFMDKAIAANLRVDYIAIHNYQCGLSAASLKSWLQDVYDRYHLPIWLTEFNNGANWTGCGDPTQAQNASVIGSFIDMMDETPWIERYSIYSRVEQVRELTNGDGTLTPTGQVYHDNESPIGYLQESTNSTNSEGRGVVQLPLDGSAVDTSGYGHSGQVAGYSNYVPGQDGQALQLDGDSNFVVLPEEAIQGSEFSFAAWVYWDGGQNWQRVFDFGNDTNQYLFLTPSNGSNMRFAIKNGGGEQIVQTAPLATGQWTHLAVTLGGGSAKLYVNGSQMSSSAVTINPDQFLPSRNYLGRSQFDADPLFSGRIDDVLITDTVLTPTQIAALMGSNTPPQFSVDTLALAPAEQGEAYSGSLAGLASDIDAGDTLTYGKAHGPAWLTVAADGTLGGTPTGADLGLQEFVLTATDASGTSDFVVATIPIAGTYWRGDVSNVWTANNGGDTNWASDLSGSTDPGVLPDASIGVNFATTNSQNLPGTVLGGDVSVKSVRVATTSDVTVGGTNNLTLGSEGLITEAGAGATTIDTTGQVILAADQTWTIDSPATVDSVVAGTAGLTKQGAETLVLAGDNIYSGLTTVAAGTLQLGSGGSTGSVAGDIVNQATLLFNSSAASTYDGDISGSGELVKHGVGRLILNTANSYTGGTTIGANSGTGVVQVAASGALGTGDILLGPGGNGSRARLELIDNVTLANDITLVMRNNITPTIYNFGGNNILSGTISLEAGGSEAVLQSDGGFLALGDITSAATGSRIPTLAGSGQGVVLGTISNGAGIVGLNKTGSGIWKLRSSNTYTGTTTIIAGTLEIDSNERIANSSAMVLAGGTFSTDGADETVGTLSLTGNSSIDFGSGSSIVSFSGPGSFTAGRTLTLTNWTSGSDQLFIGNSATLSSGQLAQINFNGAAAQQLASGEIVPVGPLLSEVAAAMSTASLSAQFADVTTEPSSPVLENTYFDAGSLGQSESAPALAASSSDEIWTHYGLADDSELAEAPEMADAEPDSLVDAALAGLFA